MSTFDEIKEHGDGAIDFRLEIEGWPIEWVTNTRITHADNADGRTVLGGLHYEGIELSERIVMAEALLQVKPIAFRITPPYKIVGDSTQWTDEDTYWLARETDPVESIDVALAYDDDEISFTSGSTWANGTVFFINTETIRVTNWPTIERAVWGSQAQAHPLGSQDRVFDVYTYTQVPPTMEGRRVWLYAYGEGDDPDGNGTVIWRGVVVRVPYLAGGAMANTWVIDCESITHLLNQNVAGAIDDAKIVGIYHHQLCPFVVEIQSDGDSFGPFHYTGIDLNEANFITSINDWLDDVIVNDVGGAADGYFDFLGLVKTDDGLVLQGTRSSDASIAFRIRGGSVLVGFFDAVTIAERWRKAGQLVGLETLDPSETYYIPLTMDSSYLAHDTGYVYAGAPATVLGDCRPLLQPDHQRNFQDSTAAASFPPWLLAVDTDLTGVDYVYINGTRKPDGLFRVLDAGISGGAYYVLLEPWQGPPASAGLVGASAGGLIGDPLAAESFLGFLGGDTVVDAVRSYDTGRIDDFVRALKIAGRDFGNTGDTPFVTDSDMTDLEPVSVHGLARWRVYSFLDRLRLRDILTAELRFINHFLRLDSEGKIDSAALPRWTEATSVNSLHEIDGSSILTQNDGVGSAPTYTPNRDGRITMLKIQHRYLPRTNEWEDKPAVFFDPSGVSASKNRGKAPEEIKPYSTPAAAAGSDEATILREEVARPRLNYFSRNYGVVRVEVPFTKFDILCGDIVSLTHPDIPDGEGARGVTGRRGVVIERRWNMDGAKARRGELTILLTPRGIVGYAPSGILVSATNVSGDTWTVTFSTNTATYDGAINAEMVQDGESIASHFAAGDFVRVYELNSYTPTAVLGIVQSVSVGTHSLTIAFDSTWTPGEGESWGDWVLEYQTDVDGTDSTSSQKRYCYVADVQALMPDGSYARRFA